MPAGSKVYAIVKREPRAFVDGDFRLPAGEYAIVVAFDSPSTGFDLASNVVHVTGDRIVTTSFWCGQSPAQRVEGTPAEAFVLPPR